MKIIRSASDLVAESRRVCAAIGVFDGLHLGHQEVLMRARSDASRVGGLTVVVTFDRHPNAVVAPDRTPLSIYSLSQKMRVLASLGVDVTWLIPFDAEFSRREAEGFVRQLSIDFCPLHSLSVGAGFTFGYRRGGNLEMLRRLGEELGFWVHGLEAVEVGGVAISSTRIREAIRAGELREAESMLGRPYSVTGPVVRGDGLGRKLGIPTANLGVTGLVLPPDGVYAVEVRLGERLHPAVLNIGVRPTLRQSRPSRQFEVHLLDFAGDLYERELEVVFKKWLRGEQRFLGMEELRVQIGHDIEAARELLGVAPRWRG